MLKAIFYFLLTIFGLGAAVVNPVWGAVTCILAYLMNPTIFDPSGQFIRYQLATTLVFLLTATIHPGRGLKRVGKESWMLYALWAFAFIGFASAAWAEVSSMLALSAFLEVAKTILLITVFVKVITTERDFDLLILACIIGSLHGGVLTVLGARLGYINDSRDLSVFPDPSQAVLAIFVPLLILIAAMTKGWRRWLAAGALVFVLDGIVKSYERTGLVVLAIEACAILLFIPWRLALKVAPALLAAAAAFLFVFTPADYWERMTTILAPTEEGSAASRFVIFEASMKMFVDHPFGVGYRNYPDVSPRYLDAAYLTGGKRSAHNSFTTILCETGFIGFLLWGFVFAGTLLLLRHIRKRTATPELHSLWIYATGCEVGLYGWAAGSMTQAWHEVDPAYWFVAFAVILYRLYCARTGQIASGPQVTVISAPTVLPPPPLPKAPEPPPPPANATRFTRLRK